MVDQCGAMSTNLPPALSDSNTTDPLSRIDTPFPPEMSEFEDPSGALSLTALSSHVQWDWGDWETLKTLYDFKAIRRGEEMQMRVMGRSAMVVKAIELFSRAWKLSKHGSFRSCSLFDLPQ